MSSDIKRSAEFCLKHLKGRGIRNIKMVQSGSSETTCVQKDAVQTKSFIEGLDINCSAKQYKNLDDVRSELGDCNRCQLSGMRTNLVFGEGNPNAQLMFVGEGPGEDEDNSGRPFVGRAGQLLNKIIEAMGLKREEVYIANIVKCRPPGNRAPVDEEIIKCAPFLMGQISVIKPKVIVALGSPATCTLFNKKIKISAVRGEFYDWNYGIKLMPTFHPAYLLRNPKEKGLVWEDMKKVMSLLGLKSKHTEE